MEARAGELAAGRARAPLVRTIRAQLHVGQPHATAIADYLAARTTDEKQRQVNERGSVDYTLLVKLYAHRLHLSPDTLSFDSFHDRALPTPFRQLYWARK